MLQSLGCKKLDTTYQLNKNSKGSLGAMRAGLDDQAELLQQKLAKALSRVALLIYPHLHQQTQSTVPLPHAQGGRGTQAVRDGL